MNDNEYEIEDKTAQEKINLLKKQIDNVLESNNLEEITNILNEVKEYIGERADQIEDKISLISSENSGGTTQTPQYKEIPKEEAWPCDVVFWNFEEERIVIRREKESWRLDEYPIGIVVIPTSHGVLKDGSGTKNQCGIMSLVSMSYNDPENGIFRSNKSGEFLEFTNNTKITDDGLNRYDSVPLATKLLSPGVIQKNPISHKLILTEARFTIDENHGSLPIQYYFNENPLYYTSDIGKIPNNYIPSPYLFNNINGSYNPEYGITDLNTSSMINIFGDFAGISNCKIIIDAMGKTDWKTTTPLPGTPTTTYPNIPLYCCCRYKTHGTKAFKDCTDEELYEGSGFWYLPAMGEIGYIMAKYQDINETLDNIYKMYECASPLGSSVYDNLSESLYKEENVNYNTDKSSETKYTTTSSKIVTLKQTKWIEDKSVHDSTGILSSTLYKQSSYNYFTKIMVETTKKTYNTYTNSTISLYVIRAIIDWALSKREYLITRAFMRL